MMTLIAEIGQLRQELNRGRKRIAYLSNLADHDDLSTVLNRRAFLREPGHAQVLAREYGALNTLLFVTIRNLGDVNEEFGHAARDLAASVSGCPSARAGRRRRIGFGGLR